MSRSLSSERATGMAKSQANASSLSVLTQLMYHTTDACPCLICMTTNGKDWWRNDPTTLASSDHNNRHSISRNSSQSVGWTDTSWQESALVRPNSMHKPPTNQPTARDLWVPCTWFADHNDLGKGRILGWGLKLARTTELGWQSRRAPSGLRKTSTSINSLAS